MPYLAALRAVVCLLFLYGMYGPSTAAAGEVKVLSSREAEFIEPLLRVYEGLTGHKVSFIHAGADLTTRLKGDGTSATADILIASEFSQLLSAKQQGFTRATKSLVLADRIPDVYRDEEGHWFGLTRRARVIVVAVHRPVRDLQEPRYSNLANVGLRGRICMRSGFHPYNVALVASLIEHEGVEATQIWLAGLKSNLARKPTGGDRDQILAVHKGQCDAALVNSYYVANMSKSSDPELRAAANGVRVLFPNNMDRGTHVTVSGMALASSARNLSEAELLMDFLTSRPAQKIFAQDNDEWPVLEDELPSKAVASWGELEAENLPLGQIARHFAVAVQLIEKSKIDAGPEG